MSGFRFQFVFEVFLGLAGSLVSCSDSDFLEVRAHIPSTSIHILMTPNYFGMFEHCGNSFLILLAC